MTITQLIVWTTAPDEPVIDDVAKSKLREVQSVSGIQSSYFGEQHAADLPKGVKKRVWVNLWDSYESANKQVEHIVGLFEKERAVEILHADVNSGSDIEKTLALPTIEVAHHNPKPGDSDKWTEDIRQLRERFEIQGHPTAWGPNFKDPNDWLVLVGWHSREEHMKAVDKGSSDPEVIEVLKIIQSLSKHAEMSGMFHVNLKRYSD